jgi:hypothetical protein
MPELTLTPAEVIDTDARVSSAEAAGSIALIGSELNPVPGASQGPAQERIEPGQRIPAEMPADPRRAVGYDGVVVPH